MPVASKLAMALRTIEWWEPPRMWEGETCYILGGGPSLGEMDLTPLHGQHVIGCNDAYTLGPWVDICLFGDWGWWLLHGKERVVCPEKERDHDGLLRFPGLIVCHTPLKNLILILEQAPRVRPMRRAAVALEGPRCRLAWYDNVGASAIHLALLLGASRIVLLGYDGQRTAGRQNWHRAIKEEPPAKHNKYHCFMHDRLARDVERHSLYRQVEIVNASPGTAMTAWPLAKWEEVRPC